MHKKEEKIIVIFKKSIAHNDNYFLLHYNKAVTGRVKGSGKICSEYGLALKIRKIRYN